MYAVANATFLKWNSSFIILDCLASAGTLAGMISNRSNADNNWSRGGNSVGSKVGNCWDYGRLLCMKDQSVTENVRVS